MNDELASMVSFLERERGVSSEIIIQAIETAIQQAARKNIETSDDFRVIINRKTYEISAYDVFAVSDEEQGLGILSVRRAKRFDPEACEGGTVRVPLSPAQLGRIAAQTAKQSILQKIREAERKNVYDEYKDRIGEIVTGSVKLVAHKDIFVELGKTEAIIPYKERIPIEEYIVGNSIRAYVMRVQSNTTSGPAVELSRSCPDFLKALFRLEVSEIAEGIVEVMSVARDPGRRAKIAVRSLDPQVDAVGACVGMRGARVRNIVRELNGEKIDIVRWSDNISEYVKQALSPAEPISLEVDKVNHTVVATVASDKLSLAIGRAGQNVRLATKLTGWKVSITAETEIIGEEGTPDNFESKRDKMIYALATTLGITTIMTDKLFDAGFHSPEGIVIAEPAYVTELTGFSAEDVLDIYNRAQAHIDTKGE